MPLPRPLPSPSNTAASSDKTVSVWDPRSGLPTQTFYGHRNSVNQARYNQQGTSIASCDADGVVKLWDVRMVAEILTIATSPYPANKASWDASGMVGGLLVVVRVKLVQHKLPPLWVCGKGFGGSEGACWERLARGARQDCLGGSGGSNHQLCDMPGRARECCGNHGVLKVLPGVQSCSAGEMPLPGFDRCCCCRCCCCRCWRCQATTARCAAATRVQGRSSAS